jgi:hypothetical protein
MCKFCAVLVLGLVSITTVAAYQATTEPVLTQYEVVTVSGDPKIEQSILGELSGSPEMFEIVSDVEFPLTVEIRAVPNKNGTTPDFSGIIIRQKEKRGVEEVARLKAADAGWNVQTEGATGLRYLAGPFYSEVVPAGTYRIEVSTPENVGKYILVIGTEPEKRGYLANLKTIALTYQFYGLSKIRMFSSPFVHYPIGCFILIGLIGYTWYWQRTRKIHA